MSDCRTIGTPMDPNVKLLLDQGEFNSNLGRHQRLVGKLNYLTMTKPNMTFPISVMS